MDTEEALDSVTEITVTASETRQISQYEPSESEVSLTATVGDDVDVDALQKALSQEARERAEREIMHRIEEHIKQEAGVE